MQVPFSNEEFDEFTDFYCAQSNNNCEKCAIKNECTPYCNFERGFALSDKKIIQEGLQFAQKMNNTKFTVYEIAKIPIKNFNTLEEAEKYIDSKYSDKKYTIELTES